LEKRPLTPLYLLFYIIFWPDTWRIAIGILAAMILAPSITTAEIGAAGAVMLFIMIATMGYAVSQVPAQAISQWLKKIILKRP
jgi:hypothetical protein